MPAVALTDHNNLSGAVEFHKTALSLGIKPIQGAEITLADGSHLTLLAENEAGYGSLCRILTAGYANKTECRVSWQALRENGQNLIALSGCHRSAVSLALLRKDYARAKREALRLREIFGRIGFIWNDQYFSALHQAPAWPAVSTQPRTQHSPLAATNNVHYLAKADFPIHDLLICIRTKSTLRDLDPERPLNGENYFASPTEMKERFAAFPQAVANTLKIAERCEPALNLEQNLFPPAISPHRKSRESD